MNRLARILRGARTFGACMALGAVALGAPQGVGTALAQADTTAQERPTLAALRQTIEERYQVLPVQDGIVLLPRYGSPGVQSIELSEGDIAIATSMLEGALMPGGYLFLGHAETLRGLSQDFELQHTHGTF